MVNAIIVLALSYLVGSIPNGYLIGKFNGLDIRHHGSKNIGATNVRRILGRDWGILCFVLDFLKGVVPVVFIGRSFGNMEYSGIIAAIGAVLGHVFPVWLGFHGGKGVATSLGVVVGLAPFPFFVGIVIWLLSFYFAFRGVVSIASMLSVLIMALTAFVCKLFGFRSAPDWITVTLLFILAIIIIVRHKENIKRLQEGKENSFFEIKK